MSNNNSSNSNSNSNNSVPTFNNNYMVTLSFGNGIEATVTRQQYFRLRTTVLSNAHGFARSHSVDKIGIENALSPVIDTMDVEPRVTRFHLRLVHLTLRLALKLGIFSPPMLTPAANQLAYATQRRGYADDAESRRQARRFKQFLLDIGKFYRADIREGARTRQNAYDISGDEPFTSLDDGTFWGDGSGTNRYEPADPRVAKVKRVLRRHLGRVPTDKDIDTFVYMYFGSDKFGGVPVLKYGIQNSHYTASGRHTRRDRWDLTYNTDGTYNPIRRRMARAQRRVRRLRGPQRQRRYEYGSNSENRSNYSSSNDNRNNSNNSNNSNTSARYVQNKSRVNANKAKNKSYKNSIKWEEHTVNNLPEDLISFEPFSNGQKAIKIDKYNRYYSPQTFRVQARMSMADAFNKHGNAVLFKHPMTRQNVRRSNIKFVVLKNKNTGRATKAKKNAANKIGDARRRQLTRRSTLVRAKAVMAALKRKRAQ